MKLSIVTTNKDKNDEEVMSDSDSENNDNENVYKEESNKDMLYRFVGAQSKMCMRKSLGVAIQMYSKFNFDSEFI